MAREAWKEVDARPRIPAYDMAVADELTVVLRYDHLPLKEVLAVLAADSTRLDFARQEPTVISSRRILLPPALGPPQLRR